MLLVKGEHEAKATNNSCYAFGEGGTESQSNPE